jgi:hypothetical protein
MTHALLDRLAAGPVLCAEGYLFELERRGFLQAGAYVPEVVLEHPEAVAGLHRELVRAGSDVVEAFTYYAHREKLRLIGHEDLLEPMNRQALAIAGEGRSLWRQAPRGGRRRAAGDDAAEGLRHLRRRPAPRQARARDAEAHHFCRQVNQDFIRCTLFDGIIFAAAVRDAAGGRAPVVRPAGRARPTGGRRAPSSRS